jgi:hypothetical protein
MTENNANVITLHERTRLRDYMVEDALVQTRKILLEEVGYYVNDLSPQQVATMLLEHESSA